MEKHIDNFIKSGKKIYIFGVGSRYIYVDTQYKFVKLYILYIYWTPTY